MELICGACALQKGLPIAERMAIAESRKPTMEYACPICGQTHQAIYQKTSAKVLDISSKPKKEQNQLTLF